MKILIVEDDPGLRDSLKELLEASGHQVLAAEDGLQGLALAAQAPEFVFCDVNMPNLDGHGMLVELRKMPGVGDVPFVFLTARDERGELRAGMSLGADDYITKPYSVADILGAIAARTRRQRGFRERLEVVMEARRRETGAQWSHELLTPLNAILGCLSLLEEEADTIERKELKEVLALLRSGAERQERLSRKLINYFSLDQLVNASASPAPGRCAAEVAITKGANRAATLRKRETDITIAAEPAEVALQEYWLTVAVSEVTENAAIFSPAGSPISVTGVKNGGRYRITISDQGPGLSAEQRAQIGSFTQFDRKTREQQGLGLGLAIARLAVRLAGGELILEPGPGERGLRVVLQLPLAPAN